MNQRREFIKTLTAAAIAMASGKSELSATPHGLRALSGAGQPDDEQFWGIVRKQFPLNRERIYLNNGGLGPSPYVVLDAAEQHRRAQEAVSETGHTTDTMNGVKQIAAKMLGCSKNEIAYMRNTTEGVNVVCHGLSLKAGDEVISSRHEHIGNTLAWVVRQQRDGIVVKTFEPSMQSSAENLDRIKALITPKTRALSLMQVSTATGHILPLVEIGELARKHNLWYFVDGAQSAGMLPVDVSAIGCHAFATSGHKWLLGPKGTGLLFVREDMLELLKPVFVGAYSNQGDFSLAPPAFTPNASAQRYEYGTVDVSNFVGLGAAMAFLQQLGMEQVWARNKYLTDTLRQGLQQLGAEVLSAAYKDGYGSMLTFKLPGWDYKLLQPYLHEKHHLRLRGIYEGGLDAIRVSLHIYNSMAEVQRILDGVSDALKQKGSH